MKGFNFGAYLRNYDIIQAIGTNKTRKQFKNFLRVMYGKKKDRGRIKKKIEKYIQEDANIRAEILGAISKVMPHLSIMGQSFYW